MGDASSSGGAAGSDAGTMAEADRTPSGGDDMPIGPPPDFGPNVLNLDPGMPMATIQNAGQRDPRQQIGYPAHEFADHPLRVFSSNPGQYQVGRLWSSIT